MHSPLHLRRRGDETVWTATGHERPVFLDEHGRRRRWVLLGGALSGGAAAMWLAALVAGAIGFSSLPSMSQVPRLVAQRAGAQAGRVHRHRTASHRGGQPEIDRTTGLAVSQTPLPLP